MAGLGGGSRNCVIKSSSKPIVFKTYPSPKWDDHRRVDYMKIPRERSVQRSAIKSGYGGSTSISRSDLGLLRSYFNTLFPWRSACKIRTFFMWHKLMNQSQLSKIHRFISLFCNQESVPCNIATSELPANSFGKGGSFKHTEQSATQTST